MLFVRELFPDESFPTKFDEAAETISTPKINDNVDEQSNRSGLQANVMPDLTIGLPEKITLPALINMTSEECPATRVFD